MMHPKLREKEALFSQKMKERGLKYILTSVDRTILEQMALYVQGRLIPSGVNMFRALAGLERIDGDDSKIVTYTLNSYHVTNMFDDILDNDFSRAFDIALLKYKRPHWDLKISVNANEIPDYQEAGIVAAEVGLEWGGNFKFKDLCHFQLPKEDLCLL